MHDIYSKILLTLRTGSLVSIENLPKTDPVFATGKSVHAAFSAGVWEKEDDETNIKVVAVLHSLHCFLDGRVGPLFFTFGNHFVLHVWLGRLGNRQLWPLADWYPYVWPAAYQQQPRAFSYKRCSNNS